MQLAAAPSPQHYIPLTSTCGSICFRCHLKIFKHRPRECGSSLPPTVHLHAMTTHHPRRHPIILITGTPGTGKTLHSSLLAAESDGELVHLNIGDIVKLHGLHEGWDDEWQSYTVDEDRLLDHLEEIVNPASGPAETGAWAGRLRGRADSRLHPRPPRPRAVPRALGRPRRRAVVRQQGAVRAPRVSVSCEAVACAGATRADSAAVVL